MEQYRINQDSAISDESIRLAKLICKLRWIGMEEEARQLQLAHRLSMARTGVTLVEPRNTD